MNTKYFLMIVTFFILLMTIFFLNNKKENYTRFSTGRCSSDSPNCPKGSYLGSCNVSFNTNDWGDNYFSGTCGKDVCKDRDDTISNRCTKTERVGNSVFGYLPSDFFNNPGAYSFDNRGGELVLNEDCLKEKNNYKSDPAGYTSRISGLELRNKTLQLGVADAFHKYADIKRNCGDVVPMTELLPAIKDICDYNLDALNKQRSRFMSVYNSQPERLKNLLWLCPGFQDAYTGYTTNIDETLKSKLDNILKENKSNTIADGKSILSGDALISSNKKWVAYLDNDGEFIIYNPESGKIFRLLQTLNINKTGFEGPFKLTMGIIKPIDTGHINPGSITATSDAFLYLNDKNNKLVAKLGYGQTNPINYARYTGPFNLRLDDDGKVCIRDCGSSRNCNTTLYCMN